MYNSLQPLGLQHSRLPCPSLHHLPEVAQTYIHWVSDAIQPSQSLSSPSPPAFSLSQHQGLHWTGFSHQVADILELQFQHQSFPWIFKGDFTEHLLNCSRRPWTPNMTRKISMQLGRMKERKKKKRGNGKDQHALWETEVRSASEKPIHSRGISWRRKECSGNHRGVITTSLWKAGHIKNWTHSLCCSPVHHRLSCVSIGEKRDGCWKVEFGEWIQGGDSCWLWTDSLKRQEQQLPN